MGDQATAAKTLGQIAFEAYNESKGGLTYDGKPIPPWDELSGDRAAVHRAWEAAAESIARTMLDRGPSYMIGVARRTIDAYPRSREASLAITKLDEARMWIAAIPMESLPESDS